MDNIIETLVSVPFAIAVTALLRKRWPAIDGWAVYVVVLVCTILGAVAAHYRAQIPPEVWTAAGPVLAAVLALGGVQTAAHVAAKAKEPIVLPSAKAIDEWIEREVDRPTVPPRSL